MNIPLPSDDEVVDSDIEALQRLVETFESLVEVDRV
jgi:hypothetical protein